MDTNSPMQIEIPMSKSKVVMLILGAIAFVAGGIWLWLMAEEIGRSHPLYVKIVAIACVLFFGLCAIYGSFKVFDARPGLIIDDQGIIDNSSGVAAGRIFWDEIIGLTVSKKFITILVVNPEKFLARGNFLIKFLNMANMKLTGSPINISSHALAIKFDELVRILLTASAEYKGPANNAFHQSDGG